MKSAAALEQSDSAGQQNGHVEDRAFACGSSAATKSFEPRQAIPARLKLQPDIPVTALGTWRGIRAGFFGVEMVTADAVKTDLPALVIIERPIPPVVIKPQGRKQAQDQQAVEQDGDGEIGRRDHGLNFTRRCD